MYNHLPAAAWNAWVYLVMAASIALAFILMKRGPSRGVVIGAVVLLVVDLYGFSLYDIKKDFAAYADLKDQPSFVGELKSQPGLKRVYTIRSHETKPPFVPSVNMLYGIDDIGVYAPLADKRYL